MIKRLLIFVFLFVLSSNIFAIDSLGGPLQTMPNQIMTPSTCPECFVSDAQSGEGCRTIVLDPRQVQSLWDNYLGRGLRPNTIYSGRDQLPQPLDVRRTGDGNTRQGPNLEINNVNTETGEGIQVALPNQGVSPDRRNTILRESCKGDFAYALVLADTMRIGRCLGQDINNCSVRTSGLKYRNSSTAIGSVTNSFSELLGGNHYSATNQDPNAVAEVPNQEQAPELTVQDLNDLNSIDPSMQYLQGTRPVRIAGDPITNHAEADGYDGEFQSVCEGETASTRCQVILLSYFDKYYNANYSGTMLASVAGPAIWGLSKKALMAINQTKAGSAILGGPGSFGKTLEDATRSAYNKVFQKDIKILANDLKAQMTEFDAMGFGGLRTELQAVATKSPDDVIKVIDKVLPDLAKDPYKAKLAYKMLGAETRFAESTVAAAGATDDVLVRATVFRDAADSGIVTGTKINKSFFAEPENAFYSTYYVEKSPGVHVPATAEWKDFVTGKYTQAFREVPHTGPPTLQPYATFEDYVKTLPPAESYFVQDAASGSFVRLTPDTASYAKNLFSPGAPIPVVRGVGGTTYAPVAGFASENVAKAWNGFAGKQFGNMSSNLAQVRNAMLQRGIMPKTYFNSLNWWIYNDRLAWNKFNLGRVAGTLFGSYWYWQAKTNDDSPFKSYFIGKDDYTNVKFSLGAEQVYNDAYFDIFANAPISNGDVFGKAIQRAAAFIEDLGLKGTQETLGLLKRDSVQNIIIYTATKDNCPSCTSTYKMVGEKATVRTKTYSDSVNYVLEYPDAETYVEDGASLAIFAHHTDFDLKTKQINKTVNIQKGITTADTCIDRGKGIKFLGGIDYFTDVPSRIGLAAGIVDSGSMFAYGLMIPTSGLSVMALSLLTSYLIAEEVRDTFGDCVDSEDGYYVQYIYNPPAPKEEGNSILDSLSGVVSSGEQTVQSQGQNQVGNSFDRAMNDIKNQVINTVEGADKEFLQLYFETKGKADAKIESESLFLTWIKGGSMCTPNSYDTESVTLLQDGNNSILIDNNAGTISINGQTILQSPLVRTMSRNYIAGAMEMAQSATFVPAIGYSDFFELTSNGGINVISPEAYSCIARGLEIQTGRQLTSQSLTSILGRVNEASTSQGAVITTDGMYFTVTGGGVEREVINGRSVLVNKDVHMVVPANTGILDLGIMDSIILEKGVILYDNARREFIVWARILAEMLGSEIARFNASPTTVKNPITGCDEHAVDLSVVGNQGDYTASQDAELMNQALQKAGPYQYFETPSKTFYFYSKLENGQCKPYMQIRDKQTGEVLVDAPISLIQKTADGFNVTTEDGKTHQFGFSAENGRPILTYNGEKDLLLMAQGRNGSFYFDPKTGKWYVGNSQLLPLNDQFREQGELSIGGISRPGGNPLYSNPATLGKQGGWDIPLFSEKQRLFFVLMSVLLAGFIYFRLNKK